MSQALVKNAAAFQSALINWYDENARDLPWRVQPSLYKTVVSEFMLQQTQVKTVLPYFAKWLKSYPDFANLAQASEEQVLKSWEGLGYYSRARNLLKLAKEISAIPADEIPQDAKSWLKFPGIGPYAAAAVCSIAFSDQSAVVDGNVVRILSRMTADESSYTNSTEAAKVYRPLVQELLNRERPGDHNQAMMELGATVCHKNSPNCLLCPVREHCLGFEKGIAESLPKLAKIKFEDVTVNRAWIQKEGSILLHKIPANAKRMRGLHELPELAPLSIPVPSSTPIATRKRGITRYRITERIFDISPASLPNKIPEDYIWAKPDLIESLAFSGPHRKWIGELLAR
ncbi:A/G-specific adenine glycosylase [Pelagicoccus albus]|uniref:A/G-specific adenine glycosylase n=1 Tax=Pelagicoccus albus TaxID=415222 RepID=A0A7X1B481_9BACT|nr:A/G-specific adenine glycosylase [Pelagicoccus albus]MBC2605320.1 A/G-specific adenine glycosylase [Pelagicoccus albus]